MNKYDFTSGIGTSNYPAVQVMTAKIKLAAGIWHQTYLNACEAETGTMPKLRERIHKVAIHEADAEFGAFLEAVGKAIQGEMLTEFDMQMLEYYLEDVEVNKVNDEGAEFDNEDDIEIDWEDEDDEE